MGEIMAPCIRGGGYGGKQDVGWTFASSPSNEYEKKWWASESEERGDDDVGFVRWNMKALL